MAEPKIYPKGFKVFAPNEKAPDFVKGALVVSPNIFNQWLRENTSYLTEYKGEKQIRFDILQGRDGLTIAVNTFKPTAKGTVPEVPGTDDLPF